MQACSPWEQTGDAHYMIAVPAAVGMTGSDKSAMFAAGWTKRVNGTVTRFSISYEKSQNVRLLRLPIHPASNSPSSFARTTLSISR